MPRAVAVACLRAALPFVLWLAALPAVLLGVASPAGAEILRGHGGPVRAIVEPATPGQLVTGSFDQSVIRWRLPEARAEAVLRGHEDAVAALAALPDGRFVSAGADGRIVVWPVAGTAPERSVAAHKAPVAGLAVSPDGRLVASASWDRTVAVTPIGAGTARVFEGHADNVNGVAFLPDGRAVVSAGYDATLRLWPLGDGEAPSILTLPTPLNAVVVAPDGEIVAAGADGALYVAGASGGSLATRGRLEVMPGPVVALAITVDGSRLAAAGLGGAVVLVDRMARRPVATLVGPGLPVWSLAFARDGRSLFTGGADRLVRRWDAVTGRPVDAIAPNPRDPAAETSTARGAIVFRACRACHGLEADDTNRAGPTLHGLMGRRIATAAGYDYSAALKGMDIVWTPETVARLFEVGPSAYTPGTRMPEQVIADPDDRRALVEWLAEVTR
ncbi:c-type cytochrome [Prosthecodimorpha staleyi]|uniref:C-type cytochrome n=1 Tax=Prosthecodimorpha staleyi TaxID=2840188 RepID=A0A947D6F5_9HYPH|nr:c-type cytochrome [Prosthecodimorpha staleyi]MBT9289062.1 c-type cytochrome [Prosthecodimorpha staleyi]